MSRIFNISIEGVSYVNGLDLFAVAGYNAAFIYQVPATISVADGILSIQFIPVKNNPVISGIEVVLAPSIPTPVSVPTPISVPTPVLAPIKAPTKQPNKTPTKQPSKAGALPRRIIQPTDIQSTAARILVEPMAACGIIISVAQKVLRQKQFCESEIYGQGCLGWIPKNKGNPL